MFRNGRERLTKLTELTGRPCPLRRGRVAISTVRPIRLLAKGDGSVRTAGSVEDADRPQLTLIRGYKDELQPLVEAYGEVEVFIRPATPIPPAPTWPTKPAVPNDWQDHAGWCRLLAFAHHRDNRRWVVSRWATAAGGELRDGALHLPANLPHGLALAELRTAARNVGLRIEVAP